MEEFGITVREWFEFTEAPPLDFSFRNIENFHAELRDERPGSERDKRPLLPDRTGKYRTRSIWFTSNRLATIDGLEHFLNRVLANVPLLAWLDISLNRIKDVHDEILKFSNLKILYLHGNYIDHIEAVMKLSGLKKLRKLTLHGNPVTMMRHYRKFVIHILPELINLDFSKIIDSEKITPYPIGAHKKYPDFF